MTHSTSGFRFRVAWAAVAGVMTLAGLAALPSAALAQLGLPDSVVNPPSGQLGSGDAEQIRAYIAANKDGLAGDGPAIERSRRALLAPLRSREVGSVFRVEYTAQLLPVLKPLASGTRDDAAINAARILGELASSAALKEVAIALKDKRAAVRLVAAKGYEQTLNAASAGQPAIVAREAQTSLTELAAALQSEADPLVADAIVSAMAAGVNADSTKLQGVRADAVRTLSNAISEKARAAGSAAFMAALARATGAMFDAVKDPDPSRSLADDSVVDAAGVAGDMLALAVRTDCTKLDEAQKANFRQLLRQAENVYLFSRNRLEGTKPSEPRLAESFCVDQGRFRRDALQAIAELTKPGGRFSRLKDSRFPTK